MPKKTANARGNAQRNRNRSQKSVQLVRPTAPTTAAESQSDIGEEAEATATNSSAVTLVAEAEQEISEGNEVTETAATSPAPLSAKRARTSREAPVSAPATSSAASAPRSASARMATRRQQQQAAQKSQRQAPSLITAEHYSYVRKDLIFIAILAIIMFSTLIVLHFVPAIGG